MSASSCAFLLLFSLCTSLTRAYLFVSLINYIHIDRHCSTKDTYPLPFPKSLSLPFLLLPLLSSTGFLSPWSCLLCLLLFQKPQQCARLLLLPYWALSLRKRMSHLCGLGHFFWRSLSVFLGTHRIEILKPLFHFSSFLFSSFLEFPYLSLEAAAL